MSKSDPNSAIFMEDSEAEVKTKIKKAFCPPQQVGRMATWPCAEGVIAEGAGILCTRQAPATAGQRACCCAGSRASVMAHGIAFPGCLVALDARAGPTHEPRARSSSPLPQVAGNPCLSYVQHIVLPWCEKFEVERAEANGGNK